MGGMGGVGGAKRLPENQFWKLDDVTRHNRSYKFAAWRRGSEEKWHKATRSVLKRYVLQISRSFYIRSLTLLKHHSHFLLIESVDETSRVVNEIYRRVVREPMPKSQQSCNATKITFLYSFSGNCTMHGVSPHFHIHVSVSDLQYIFLAAAK